MSLPPALSAYRAAGRVMRPLAGALLGWRAQSGKEDPARVGERFGRAAIARPDGLLVWLHGASVGEARVLQQVRAGLAARRSDLHFLITTGTRTSAELVTSALPSGVIHQFAPIDAEGPVRRFLDHWRPDLAVFAESELWPNLILETARTGARMALVNARMTPKSLRNWARARESAAWLLACFDIILPADSETARGVTLLLGEEIPVIGNLKLAAPAPAADPALLAALREAIGARPVWLAASTHPGEDEIALAAHEKWRATHPHALLIIAPRHPERGPAIAKLAHDAPRRAGGELPSDKPIYVLDTMGELGAAFALAPITLMAGSLIPTQKGHNPVEPAKAGSAILSGPYVQSFADMYTAIAEAGGVKTVRDAHDIAAALAELTADDARRAAMVAAAAGAVNDAGAALARTIEHLLALLSETDHAPA